MPAIVYPYNGPIVTRPEAQERGLKRFFTGRPCTRGHLAERATANSKCLACEVERFRTDQAREYARKYRKTETFKAAVRRYQQTDKFKDAVRKYRQTDGYKEIAKTLDRKRAVKRNAAKRALRQTDEGKAATRRYNQSPQHRVALRISNRARRARKHEAGGVFTVDDDNKLRARQRKCHICNRRFTADDPATLDHVIPLAKGGSHDASNIALAHDSCNREKRDRRTQLI